MPRPKVSLATCTEALGGESDHGHGSSSSAALAGLPQHGPDHELSPPERVLEQQGTRTEEEEPPPPRQPARQPPPTMPRRGVQLVPEKQGGRLVLRKVAAKNPVALQASRADGRLRLTLVPPPSHDGGDEEVGAASGDGEKGFEGGESGGGHGKSTV